MKMKFVFLLTLWSFAGSAWSLLVVCGPEMRCSQQGLACRVQVGNCSDEGLVVRRFKAPGSVTGVTYNFTTRTDGRGQFATVLGLTWRQNPDGNVYLLNGTEVRVVETATSESRCVRYVFLHPPPYTKNPQDQMWTFSLDRVVVKPGFEYQLLLTNLPKPDTGSYTTQVNLTVPENVWKPKLMWTVETLQRSGVAITVHLQTERLSEQYRVSLHSPGLSPEPSHTVQQDNQTSVRVSFTLEPQQITDCSLYLVIQPLSVQCMNTCLEYKEKVNICPYLPESPVDLMVLVLSFSLVILAVIVFFTTFLQRKFSHKDASSLHNSTCPTHEPEQEPVQEPRRILIIYSLDHPLYKEVILKLCAFLRTKCGTDVTLDLLDSNRLGTIGKIQWLDMQRQQISRSSDKILILCSPGVLAKWRAMCGEDRVRLKEDECSQMGDMLTPALSLIVLDFVHASSYHKYIVAYFDDVCSENDVPAPFHTVMKYKLMKHFEELYFRILDVEKHEPGRIKCIKGIRGDDYFSCPSGKALQDAIQAFHSYQLKHPNWFKMELLDPDDEEEMSSTQPIFPTDVYCHRWTEEREAHAYVNVTEDEGSFMTEETGVMLKEKSSIVTTDVC